MVTYGYIWSPFPKASKVVCQFMPLLQTSSRHHRAQPAQRKRAGRKSVERSGIHSRFELWNSGYDSFVLMLYRFSFFFTGIIRSPYSSPMSHCYCEIAGIFDQIIIFPCLISVFGTKKVIHRAAGAKSRSGRLGFDFPSSLRSLRLHLCDVGH